MPIGAFQQEIQKHCPSCVYTRRTMHHRVSILQRQHGSALLSIRPSDTFESSLPDSLLCIHRIAFWSKTIKTFIDLLPLQSLYSHIWALSHRQAFSTTKTRWLRVKMECLAPRHQCSTSSLKAGRGWRGAAATFSGKQPTSLEMELNEELLVEKCHIC